MVNNISWIINATSVYELAAGANTASNSLLFNLILVGITFVIFMLIYYKTSRPVDALMASGFVGFIMSIFLGSLQLVNPRMVIVYFIIFILTVLYNIAKRD